MYEANGRKHNGKLSKQEKKSAWNILYRIRQQRRRRRRR